jgi:TRAP transporter TAXI family solute receptor
MRPRITRVVCFAGLTGLLLSIITLPTVGCKQETKVEKQTKINFGTGLAANDEMNALSRSVMRAVKKYRPEFDVVFVENTGGTAEVIKNIERYDLCGISLDEAAQAYYGFWAWKGKPHPQLRLFWVTGILPVAFLVANDTGIKSISKLEGKPYGNGGEADMADHKATKLLEALDIKPRWIPDSLKAKVDLYKNGRLAGFIQSGPNEPLLSDCNERRPFTVLEISESELTKAGQRYKGSGLTYPRTVIKAGAYPGQKKNIITFGLVMGYYAKKDLPLEVAYSLIKAVWQDVWDVSASYEPLKLDIIGFPKLTLEYGPFPLHRGAVRFYRELGLKVPDRLLPPEMR